MTICDKVKGILQNKKSLLYLCCCCAAWILFLVIVFQKGYAILAYNTPKEIREMNTVVFAYHFAQGDNLYAASVMDNEIPAATSVYGILVPLILAPFLRIFSFTPLNALQICEAVTLCVEIIGAFFFYRLLYQKTSHRLLSVIGMILFYYCYWRVDAFGGAFPDQWGLTLSVILMWAICQDESREQYRPGLYAAMIIALFYIKQYFVFTVIGLCIYTFIRSKKKFGWLALYGAGGGVISVILVDYFFPLYFSEALAIMQEQVGAVSDLKFSLNQIRVLNEVYKGIIILGILHVLISIYHMIKRRDFKKVFPYELYQLICLFPIVTYLAQNPGTYYTYWLQLWYPYVVVCCMTSAAVIAGYISSLCYPKIKVMCLGIYCMLFAFSFYQVFRAVPWFKCHFMTDEEKNAWEYSYSILEKYSKEGDILVPMLLSNYCLENNIETADYGHAQCNVQSTLENYRNNKLWTNFFLVDYTEALLEKSIHYNDVEVRDKLRNQSYSCIALTSAGDYKLSEQEVIDAGYRILAKEELPSGRQRWEVTFYIND